MSLKKKKSKVSKKFSKKASKKQASKSSKKQSRQKSVKKVTKKKVTKQASSKKSRQKLSVKKSETKKSSKKTKISTKKVTVQKKASPKKVKKTKEKKMNSSGPKRSYMSFLEEELKNILEKKKQVSIKNSEGFTYCSEENCDQNATTKGYCRYHYISLWNEIKVKDKILSENQLKKFVDQMVQKYSYQVLDHMLRDLSNEKDFSLALSEMKSLNVQNSF